MWWSCETRLGCTTPPANFISYDGVVNANHTEALTIAGRTFAWGSRTYVMGIVNVTPDSFSGDGVGLDHDAAIRLAQQQMDEGADIIDVGGESTRPDATAVSEDEELRRVLPVIEALARKSIPVSVDTSKSRIARAAIEAGARMVNDVWGFRSDPDLPAVVAHAGTAAVVMENGRGSPYKHLMPDIAERLSDSVSIGLRAGIERERLIVDPGLGFGKSSRQNLAVVRKLADLRSLGLPVLVGPSRKSTIGEILNLPVEDRVEGTAALVALSIAHGADIVRVHDVRAMVRVARMSDAVMRPKAANRTSGR
jgi:dihydropteroate synthase